ncbi:hypothetical protein FGB62_89g114 [Gracilaria domingensis]|nr:hypothetical protein FGB62_89g114 [Gracilaria domingensis]
MGAQQSVALPQTAEEARAQSQAPQRQPSVLTCMMDPRMMDPYASQQTMDAEKPSSHSRNSSVNAAPGASASHMSLSLELLGDSPGVNGTAEKKEGDEERRVVEGAMSRIAPPVVRALLAGDADGVHVQLEVLFYKLKGNEKELATMAQGNRSLAKTPVNGTARAHVASLRRVCMALTAHVYAVCDRAQQGRPKPSSRPSRAPPTPQTDATARVVNNAASELAPRSAHRAACVPQCGCSATLVRCT